MVKKIAATNPTSQPEINQVTNFVVSKKRTYAIRTNNEQSIIELEGDFTKGGKKRDRIKSKTKELIETIIGPDKVLEQEEVITNYLTEKYPGLSIYAAVYEAGVIINWIKL
jgi:hypothetical protein